jgi:putative salt-induced outer membrane protein YdiY
MKRLWTIVGVACAWSCATAMGDEVLFRNGDRLTGTIIEADGGKLKIKTAMAGEVTVNMEDVLSFSTDEPIEVRLQDGSTLRQRAAVAEEGRVALQPEGPLGAQEVPLGQISKINPPAARWTGALTLSGMFTSGNSETFSFSFTGDASRRTEQDRLTFGAGYFYSEQEDPATGEDQTTADNWFGMAKYDYFLSEQWYVFGQGRLERDRLANLDLRLITSAGVGYQWVERADLNILTEAGLAWVYEDYQNAGSDSHVAARLAYRINKQFNDQISLFHSLTYLPSLERFSDFNIIADAGVRTLFTENLFTELKLEYRHDATPAPGAERNDWRFMVGAGWRF